jgi:hypothetical protein
LAAALAKIVFFFARQSIGIRPDSFFIAGVIAVGESSAMQSSRRTKRGICLAALFTALPAHAGMTVYGLTDVYRLRLQEISFFLVLLLVCAFGFKFLWNYSFKGFESVPKLTFLRALSASLLFGLLMLLILTMISGIREVLTPGAWRKQGTAYRLNDPSQEPVRKRSMEHLRAALMDYARNQEGQFPRSDFGVEIPEKLWESPDQYGTRYIYVGGRSISTTNAVLAVEPVNFGEHRFVLFSSGEIHLLPNEQINRQLVGEVKP